MIDVVIDRVAGRNVLKRKPRDETDDAGIAWLKYPIDPLVYGLKLADKRFDDYLSGVEHWRSPSNRSYRPHRDRLTDELVGAGLKPAPTSIKSLCNQIRPPATTARAM